MRERPIAFKAREVLAIREGRKTQFRRIQPPRGLPGDRLLVMGSYPKSIRSTKLLLLEIESVRVERLQEITIGDAMAEGCPFPNMQKGPDPREWFASGCAYWAENPWVWVVEFRVVEGGTND